MGEIEVNSIEKNSILLSRNTPVALVVGAAGFLGSFLVEKLLDKNIQVVGVDDFSTGNKENLEDASRNKNFHLINHSASELDLDVERLDYIFLVAGPNWNLSKVLNVTKKYASRLLFVSFIDLYDTDFNSDLEWYKRAESEIAKFCSDDKLNARVLRLSAVYGPRMHFKYADPITRLILSSLSGNIQKENTVLEFSSRALYIDDVMELIIKSMLSGSSSQKIFDGSLLMPIKVSEIKQILMDPVWYKNKGFNPSELPPWPTPNLEKTIKYLSWEPKTDLVEALYNTVTFYSNHQIPQEIPKEEIRREVRGEFLSEEKREQLQTIKPQDKKEEKKEDNDRSNKKRKFSLDFSFKFLIFGLIFYALIFPILAFFWQLYDFKSNVIQVSKELSHGEFDKSLFSVQSAKMEVGNFTQILGYFSFVPNSSQMIRLLDLTYKIVDASEHAIIGTRDLYLALKSITGEIADSPRDSFTSSSNEFYQAQEILSKTQAEVDRYKIGDQLPFLKDYTASLKLRLLNYTDLVDKGRTLSAILPQLTAIDSKKTYLILFQNNNELRPTGGFIGSIGRIDFEGGKLKKLDISDVYAIDGQLPFHVEPPKEIKSDLGQNDWYLRDSNWEADFPTSARQAEWFFNKEAGVKVAGVIALDLSAIEDLLKVTGGIDLPDYNEHISADNLFQKSIEHAEKDFFPGSQGKKNFLTSLQLALFNKLFFLPNQNWPAIVSSLNRSLEQKHLMMYLDDPKLFSYAVAQNWVGALPRPQDTIKVGESSDFLAVVEANLGANKANYYLDRSFNLNTTIGKNDEIIHRLKINYTNRSPSEAWPGGAYKNRFRMYLPFGAKLNRALWGQTDITKDVSSFADYGRSGYSMLLSLIPKETKTLTLDYQLGNRLSFKGQESLYRLDVIKQGGTLKDPFEWTISYPLTYKLSTSQGKEEGPQEYSVSTDLSVDRSFEVTFKK